jgi:hypothetical protein
MRTPPVLLVVLTLALPIYAGAATIPASTPNYQSLGVAMYRPRPDVPFRAPAYPYSTLVIDGSLQALGHVDTPSLIFTLDSLSFVAPTGVITVDQAPFSVQRKYSVPLEPDVIQVIDHITYRFSWEWASDFTLSPAETQHSS